MDPDESAGFEQTLVRLTQSERSLSQTRAKLVNAEAHTQQLEAKVCGLTEELRGLRELSQSLSRDSAAGTDECARLAESLHVAEARVVETEARAAAAEARAAAAEARAAEAEAQAAATATRAAAADRRAAELEKHAAELETRLAETEAREREALIAAEDARDERLATLAELDQLRQSRGESREVARQLAAAEARLDTLTHERVRLLELLASLEVLGREITQLTQQAAPDAPGLPRVEEWLGRDVEAEHVRATLRPEAFSAPPPQATRSWSTPEIVIDGIKLES